MTYGTRFNELRKERGVSVAAIAQKIGTSTGYISDVELGRRAPFSDKNLEIISELLNLTEEEKEELKSLKNQRITEREEKGALYEGNAFGKRIKEIRKAHGLSANKAADIIGVSRRYLNDIELGTRLPMTIKNIDKFADGLGLSDKERKELYELSGRQKG